MKKFAEFTYGNLTINIYGSIEFEGIKLNLPRSQYRIVDALVRAKGRGLTRSVLANAVGADINDETISKYVERVRASFRKVTRDFDQVISLYGFGAYRWEFKSLPPAKSRNVNGWMSEHFREMKSYNASI